MIGTRKLRRLATIDPRSPKAVPAARVMLLAAALSAFGCASSRTEAERRR
jgi:hypothetical protein